jgi:hypothetical protein
MGNFSGRTTTSTKSKKGKVSAKGIKECDEKVDGRAGPRSENVVLSKSRRYFFYCNQLTRANALFLK